MKNQNITVEPYSHWRKNIYLRLLYILSKRLNLSECYKITINFPNANFNGKEKIHIYTHISTDECSKDNIKDKQVELFIKFRSSIENFKCEIIPENGPPNYSIIVPLKFTTLFTFNNVVFSIAMLIIGIFLSL